MTERQKQVKTEIENAKRELVEAGVMTAEEFDRELSNLIEQNQKDEEFKRSIGM